MAYCFENSGLIKRFTGKIIFLVFLVLIAAAYAVPAFAADEMTFDEKLAKCLEKSEEIGLLKVCVIDSEQKQKTVLSINKFSTDDKTAPPLSCLAVFDGKTLFKITPFSAYISAIESADLDLDGMSEIIFAEKDGMANLLQVSAIKFCGDKNKKDYSFVKLFKSDAYCGGKFDILKPANKNEAPKLIIGGFVKAPGAPLAGIEYSHTFAFNPASKKFNRVSQYYMPPKTSIEEYGYAFAMLHIEKDSGKAQDALVKLISKLEKSKKSDDADTLEMAKKLADEIKKR
ncbi:MAG: hypothetical protein QMC67_10905 [Candidatus Wallbacteria bacterium]